jgi:hypothetical protein
VSETQTEAAPAATTAPTGSVLGGGATPDAGDARGWLPAEYRTDPTFKDLADVGALAKGYKNAASMVGLDKNEVLRLPREGDVPAETRAAILTRLGMGAPETPEGYGIKAPDTVRPEATEWFTAAAHEAGLSKAQAEVFMAKLPAMEALVVQQQQAATDAALAKLREEWGGAYGEKASRIEQLAQQKGVGFEAINALVVGGHLDALKLLSQAADLMLEKPGLAGGGNASGSAMTPAEAQAKIGTLGQDKEFMAKLGDRENPGHGEARRMWDELHSWGWSNEPRDRGRAAA